MSSKPSQKKFEPFTYKTLADLKNKIKALNLKIPVSPEVEILQQRVKLGNIYIPNRFAIQPMEGFDGELNGAPGELTFRRYKRYANGGAGLIWFESTAILNYCRTNPHQLVLSEDTSRKYENLVSQTRDLCDKTLKSMGSKQQCLLVLQLNHAGRYTKREGKRYPIRAFHNSDLDKAVGISEKDGKIISDDELKEIEKIWIERAKLAKEIGFDGVDIKSCHGYLINELLSSRIREDSMYGGESLDARAKLLLSIIKQSKNLCDHNFFLTTRMSIYNGIPYPNGFGILAKNDEKFPAPIDLTEPLELIQKLYDLGIRLLNVTFGNPYYSPQISRPFDTPIKGKDLPTEHPLFGLHRIFNLTHEIKRNVPKDMIIIGSGYSYLRQYAGHVAAGLVQERMVDICGFGRMAFANPDFPKQILQDGIIDKKKVCITCSKCSGLMRQGKSTGCVIRDPEYKE